MQKVLTSKACLYTIVDNVAETLQFGAVACSGVPDGEFVEHKLDN